MNLFGKMFQSQRQYQQRRDPPYNEKAEEAERDIIRKSNSANYVKVYLLSPLLDEYLIRKGLIRRSRNYDFQVNLDILRFELQRNPKFLPRPITERKLKKVVDGRNDYDHNNWEMVDRYSNKHMKAMMELADALNKRRAANEISEIRNAINAGDSSGDVSFKPFRFPNSRYSYDERAGLGINQISTAVMSGKMAKRLYRYIKNRLPRGSPPPSIDIYANTLDVIEIIRHDPYYLGPSGLRMILKLKEFIGWIWYTEGMRKLYVNSKSSLIIWRDCCGL
jgi:hypothetical protein